MIVRKLIHRWRRWLDWRELNGLTKFQQILVLLGLKRCLHFDQFLKWSEDEHKWIK